MADTPKIFEVTGAAGAADLFSTPAAGKILVVRHLRVSNSTAGAIVGGILFAPSGRYWLYSDFASKSAYDWSGFLAIPNGTRLQVIGANLYFFASGVEVDA